MIVATFNNYKNLFIPQILIDALEDAMPLFKNALPENGSYTLKNNVVAHVMRYDTKDYDVVPFENHEIMTDIQIVLEGEEHLYIAENTGLTPKENDSSEDHYKNKPADLEFYVEHPQEYARAYLTKGTFCIIFPNEAHAPTIKAHASCPVVKMVIKVPMPKN